MKTNEELQKEVQNAIKWEPQLHAAEIGVTVKNGVVTLLGTVDGYYKKIEAEKAAKSVVGVEAVVEEIDVRYSKLTKTDQDIANDVLKALLDSWSVPNEKIKIKVEKGWITLDGELVWNYQKDAAHKAIAYLPGVKGVINNIKIKAELKNTIEKKHIERALASNWTLHPENIHVSIDGTKVILRGTVSSIYQKELAGNIAWKTPGIWSLENELLIDHAYVPIV